MSWWKTFFRGSASEASNPQSQIDLSTLSPNEDSMYLEAARFVASTGRCSVSAIQRELKIGYNRAARLAEALEEDCVISGMDADGARRLLTTHERQSAQLLPSRAEITRQLKSEELAARGTYLNEKYGDEAIVNAILSQKIWEGMTAAQLFDSIGEPEAIDQKYMKTKSREVWKYHHQGSNRYLLRVTLEDGLVAGWESKG